MLNKSPWLNFDRPTWPSLKGDLHCEIAIIGVGISGIVTLYYLLTTTQKNVVLFEKNRVASGATGNNAGLAIAHIEKPASELVHMLGLESTRALFNQLNEAWEDLHAIHDEIGFKDNLTAFSNVVNGFHTLGHFISFLQDLQLRTDFTQTDWHYLVADHLKEHIPTEFQSLVEFVPHPSILTTLKAIDSSYIAAAQRTVPFKGKRMNSAKFCYKVLEYLQQHYPDRFALYEETDIMKIDLYENHSILEYSQGKVKARDTILCTNGFLHFSIWDKKNEKLYTKLHDSITPRIGYLAAYPSDNPERYALGFLNQEGPFKHVPFWYFSHDAQTSVLGGPEFELDIPFSLQWLAEKEKESLNLMNHFLKTTFLQAPSNFSYFWHGWMGYSSDGLRWVGPDLDHPHLWYNLACNGIGIVPAIDGAKKIAKLMT